LRGTTGGDAQSWDFVFGHSDARDAYTMLSRVEDDRIVGRWEASEDAGRTWRKDFDLFFTRNGEGRMPAA
jgi:hypothetical protein